jgi:DNA-directed RNA polymerase, omega subunit|tara:strand:- start:1364 stop:1642 length:279 start_codon:yes stop_codon:yes gene_type:complete
MLTLIMARVTIEDCIKKISNPFDLVLYASQRAKELNQGEPTDLDKENDKNTVISLREIANEKVSLNYLKLELIKSFQKNLSLLEEIETDKKK